MKLYYNGKIVSMDEKEREYQAIGVEGDKIVFLGSNEEAKGLDCKEKVDLKGKLMLPSFSDTHLHILYYGFFKRTIRIADATSMADIIARGKEYLKGNPKFILGMGWNQERLEEGRFPTKQDLDQISTEVPICLLRSCGHIVAVNSYVTDVLSKMDLPEEISKNADLEKGILRETAMMLYQTVVPKFTPEEIQELLLDAIKDLSSCGITCINTDDFKSLPHGKWNDVIDAYKKMEREGVLNVRVYEQCLFPDETDFDDFIAAGHRTERGGDGLFRIGPRKFLQDGSLGGKTAAMLDGYMDDPENKGLPTLNREELYKIYQKSHDCGMQLATHCIGDMALDMTVEAYGKVISPETEKKEDPREGIVHAQISTLDLIHRMGQQNLIAYIQPIFIDDDMEVVYERVGEAKAKQSYNWKTMLAEGVHCCGGSDAPVVSFNVMENIYTAVTRKNLAGTKVYLPEQKVSVMEGVRMFTSEGAYPSYDEKRRGSLEIGKLADLVVLAEDIFTIPEDNIKDVKVEETILAGKTVYRK